MYKNNPKYLKWWSKMSKYRQCAGCFGFVIKLTQIEVQKLHWSSNNFHIKWFSLSLYVSVIIILSLGGWNPAGGCKPLPLLPQLVSPGAYGWRGSSEHHSAGLLSLFHPSAAAGQCHARGHSVAPHAPAQQPAGHTGQRQQVAEQVGYSEDCNSSRFYDMWYLK